MGKFFKKGGGGGHKFLLVVSFTRLYSNVSQKRFALINKNC